jgi:hypothetical protein
MITRKISIAISTPAECDRDAQAGAEAAVTASWPVAEELNPIAAPATLAVVGKVAAITGHIAALYSA